MTFASIPFLFYFLPIFIAIYFLSPFKNPALLVGSFLFYAWGEPVYMLLLLASTVVNHVFAKAIADTGSRVVLALGVLFNLSALGWFKYAGFLADALSQGVAALGGPAGLLSVETHLPLGISFYSFQAISLLIDVKRGHAERPRSWADTALFIAMFPQLIAGPIVRYKAIADQIRQRTHSAECFADGARQFTLGLAQKVILANTFAITADAAFSEPAATLSMGAAWVGAVCYAFQIYFDFAGYSNMAIGMGRMFGFDLPANFNFPYISQSLTEFWRRWHITLSQWLRDYLYIPLGGNRVSRARMYANLWIVFVLCGLWHGAAFAFIAWGVYHGAFLVLERTRFGAWLGAAPRLVRHGYLLLIVTLGWIPFRTESIAEAFSYWGVMMGLGGDASVTVSRIVPDALALIIVAGLLAAFWPLWRGLGARVLEGLRLSESYEPGVGLPRVAALHIGLGLLLFLSAALLAGGSYNPFIYFQF